MKVASRREFEKTRNVPARGRNNALPPERSLSVPRRFTSPTHRNPRFRTEARGRKSERMRNKENPRPLPVPCYSGAGDGLG